MAKSVLELAVGTGQWDAGLKKAKSALDNFVQSNGGLSQALDKESQKMQQFVKMMGGMESSAKTAKGQMNDYKGTIEQLTMQYNRMTDAQKQAVGPDYLRAIDQLREKYQSVNNEIQEMNRSLSNAKAPDLGGGGDMLGGIGSKLDGALAVFGGNLMTKAAGAVANLGAETAEMVKQGIEMAKAGEGVRIAFERLGRGDILDGLREATHGTVTDLELMKAAVKFNDFKLPVEELGTMLAFAQQKAKDTGQSVDYMVDSIVTGLGRKSLMILDNLGLSAAEIKERMKETGDMTKAVGAIIRDQMAKAGDYVETAADRAAQANVSLQNKMEELGRKFAPVEEASNQLWTSMKIGILDLIGGPLARLMNTLTEAGRLQNALHDINGDGSGGSETRTDKALRMLREYSGRGSEGKKDLYNKQVAKFQEQEERAWRKVNEARKKYDDELKKSQKRNSASGVAGGTANMALTGYENAIKKAEAEAKAFQIARATYEKGAQDILNPKPVITGTGGTTDTKKTGGKTKEEITYASDSIMAQEKLVSDLTQKWKTASGELRDGYLKDLDSAKDKLKEMQDSADPLKAIDKQFRNMSEANYDTGYQGSQKAKEDGLRGDFGQSREAFQQAPISTQAVEQFINETKSLLNQANIGSELYTQLSEQLKDATTMSTLLQELVERGVEGADLESTAQALKEKLLSPEGIDQEAVQAWLNELNKQIEEAGGVGLKLNAKTGEVSDDKEKSNADLTTAINKATVGINALSNINSGLKGMGIDLGEDIGSAISFMQSLMTVVQGVQAIVSLFQTPAIIANTTALSALNATLLVKSFLPGFSNGGIVPAFAHGGLIGRAAAGMMIPGNSMSGDNLRLPVDGGSGMIGVNSGELILNRAQQGVIAQELEGGGLSNLQLEAVIGAEEIMLVTNNRGSRTQRGEYVQSNNRRG
jgi:hypothetical protein